MPPCTFSTPLNNDQHVTPRNGERPREAGPELLPKVAYVPHLWRASEKCEGEQGGGARRPKSEVVAALDRGCVRSRSSVSLSGRHPGRVVEKVLSALIRRLVPRRLRTWNRERSTSKRVAANPHVGRAAPSDGQLRHQARALRRVRRASGPPPHRPRRTAPHAVHCCRSQSRTLERSTEADLPRTRQRRGPPLGK